MQHPPFGNKVEAREILFGCGPSGFASPGAGSQVKSGPEAEDYMELDPSFGSTGREVVVGVDDYDIGSSNSSSNTSAFLDLRSELVGEAGENDNPTSTGIHLRRRMGAQGEERRAAGAAAGSAAGAEVGRAAPLTPIGNRLPVGRDAAVKSVKQRGTPPSTPPAAATPFRGGRKSSFPGGGYGSGVPTTATAPRLSEGLQVHSTPPLPLAPNTNPFASRSKLNRRRSNPLLLRNASGGRRAPAAAFSAPARAAFALVDRDDAAGSWSFSSSSPSTPKAKTALEGEWTGQHTQHSGRKPSSAGMGGAHHQQQQHHQHQRQGQDGGLTAPEETGLDKRAQSARARPGVGKKAFGSPRDSVEAAAQRPDLRNAAFEETKKLRRTSSSPSIIVPPPNSGGRGGGEGGGGGAGAGGGGSGGSGGGRRRRRDDGDDAWDRSPQGQVRLLERRRSATELRSVFALSPRHQEARFGTGQRRFALDPPSGKRRGSSCSGADAGHLGERHSGSVGAFLERTHSGSSIKTTISSSSDSSSVGWDDTVLASCHEAKRGFEEEVTELMGRQRQVGQHGGFSFLADEADEERMDMSMMMDSTVDSDLGTADFVYSRLEADFVAIALVGKGSFGSVFSVQGRLDGMLYAIKASHHVIKGIRDLDTKMKEVFALSALSDMADMTHIVRYHQAWIEDEMLFIQTELCDCSLEKLLIGQAAMTLAEVWVMLRHSLLGLVVLHTHDPPIVHLDIKPANIFVKGELYKLGDFGLVTPADHQSGDIVEGDARYMSRELLNANGLSLPKCDIFSLGITLFEMLKGGELPHNGPEWHDLRDGRLSFGLGVTKDMQDIVRAMMHPDPTQRPTASELLKHPQLCSEVETQIREQHEATDKLRQEVAQLRAENEALREGSAAAAAVEELKRQLAEERERSHALSEQVQRLHPTALKEESK